MAKGLTVPETISNHIKVSFPVDHVLLITLNRPEALNAMTRQMETDIARLFNWFDSEPELWVVIITGAGRMFCAGADLKAWCDLVHTSSHSDQEGTIAKAHRFGSLSRRHTSNKPVICAVNGGAYGSGMEIVLNCDIVIADEKAVFALPEVKRGIIASQGGIPRLARIVGHQLASEMLLLGRTVDALEARDRFRFVNETVPLSSLLDTAVSYARRITENSPDAVQSAKQELIKSLRRSNVEEAFLAHPGTPETRTIYQGENLKEGLTAFLEKRKPVWKYPPKL